MSPGKSVQCAVNKFLSTTYVQKIFSSFGYSKLVISMPQYGEMSLRDEPGKRHAKVSGRKRELVERYVNGPLPVISAFRDLGLFW